MDNLTSNPYQNQKHDHNTLHFDQVLVENRVKSDSSGRLTILENAFQVITPTVGAFLLGNARGS